MTTTDTTRRDVVIEDAEFIATTGGSLEQAAQRLGYTQPGNLADTLTRWGRRDIAERLRRNRGAA